MNAISKELAQQICAEIRQENLGKRFTFSWLQCWGCTIFSKGDPTKMCLSNKRGCNLVNKRYAKRSGATHQA